MISLKTRQNVESLIIGTPDVLKFSRTKNIEIMPGVFSPIFVNLRLLLSLPYKRRIVINRLKSKITSKYDYICGLESGGSYYASSLANALNLPLLLLRKANKDYGDYNRIVGEIPSPGKKVCLIDDVLATGNTLLKAKTFFDNLSCNLDALVIFSYGFEKEIGQTINLKISAISNFHDLSLLAQEKGIFTAQDSQYFQNHIQSYKDYLKQPFKLA